MPGSQQPDVSILLPAYDCEATLSECLESVVRQTETRFECIVVDDGSRDGTLDVARRFERRDARFRVVATPHTGIVQTLNAGLPHCRGAFIARMDADDRMQPDRLALQKRALAERPDWDVVGCHVRLFPRAHLAPRRLAYESWLNSMETSEQIAADAFVECPIAHPSFFARRDAILEGYRERGWAEDYDLVLRWLASGRRIGMVARPLLEWRDTPERLSRNAPEYAIDRFTACKAEHLSRSFLADGASYILWGYGGTGRGLRRALAQLGRHPSHIVELHPGRLGQRIHGAPVISPEALRELARQPLVASVAGAGPRAQIRAALREMGFREGRDFVCAA